MTPTRVWITTLLLSALLAVPGTALGQVSAEVALRAAMETETVEGDLRGAIEQYRTIAEGDDRGLAAAALVRMAGCYEKLGEPAARETYERVVSEYPNQRDQVDAARAKLAALNVRATSSDTLTVRELVPNDGSRPGADFDVSRDGHRFVYTQVGDLVTSEPDTGEAHHFYGVHWSNDCETFGSPVLSPDDTRVAYKNFPCRGETTRIEVNTLDGGHRETVYEFADDRPVNIHDWSADGERLLLSIRAPDDSMFLATLGFADRTVQRLATLDWSAPQRAQYSPDGQFIAYDSTKNGDRQIYLMSADGAQERVLVDSPGEDDQPLWTHDGRFLLFRSDRSGHWDLYALRIHDGKPLGDDVLIKANLGTGTSLRGITPEGQLFYHELVGGMSVAIAERVETPRETIQARILPKVLALDTRRPDFIPDGSGLAYLAGHYGDHKLRITDLKGEILQDIPVDRRYGSPGTPKFSPDGARLTVPVYDAGIRRLLVLSAETGALLKVLSPVEGDEYFFSLGWSQDGRRVHLLKKLDGPSGPVTRSLVSIDVETEEVESTTLGTDVQLAFLSPSREHVALVMGGGGGWNSNYLVLRSLADGSEKRLAGPAISSFVVWEADSRRLFYLKWDDTRLYSFSLDTEEETVLVEDMKDLIPEAASPDGKYWAFENRGVWDEHIWVLENFLPERADVSASR